MGLRGRLIRGLASIEETARVRLHQAANRMEDADPVEVGVALRTVQILDVIDKATGFRAAHEASVPVPQGERGPLPSFGPTPRPELGGLDPAKLDAKTRARLRQLYTVWVRELGEPPRVLDRADGGVSGPIPDRRPAMEAAWADWRALIASASAF